MIGELSGERNWPPRVFPHDGQNADVVLDSSAATSAVRDAITAAGTECPDELRALARAAHTDGDTSYKVQTVPGTEVSTGRNSRERPSPRERGWEGGRERAARHDRKIPCCLLSIVHDWQHARNSDPSLATAADFIMHLPSITRSKEREWWHKGWFRTSQEKVSRSFSSTSRQPCTKF